MWSKAREAFDRLPKPYHIDGKKFDEAPERLLAVLEERVAKKDYDGVFDLATDMVYTDFVRYHRLSVDVWKRFVVLLFNVITIKPVVHASAQIWCINLLTSAMKRAPFLDGLELPWRPLYEFCEYWFGDDMPLGSRCRVDYLLACEALCDYFPASAGQEIVDLLLPQIAPRGGHSLEHLAFLACLMPSTSNYKGWFEEFFQAETSDPMGSRGLALLFLLARKLIGGHILDDFGSILMPIVNAFNLLFVQDGSPSYFSLSSTPEPVKTVTGFSMMLVDVTHALFFLFLSPPTREQLIEKLGSCMKSARMLFHPSAGEEAPTMLEDFIEEFLVLMGRFYKHKKSPAKLQRIRDSVKDHMPTNDEIHRLLKPLVDCYVAIVPHCERPAPLIRVVRLFIQLDPSNLVRFFEFSLELIVLTDALGVGQLGWTVMTALFGDLPYADILMENSRRIFDIAVNLFYIVELQPHLMRFFYAFCSSCPFDAEKAPEKLKDLDFPGMAVQMLNATLEVARSFPVASGTKLAVIDPDLSQSAQSMFRAFFSGASSAVLTAILPVLKAVIADGSYAHANVYLNIIFLQYVTVCDDNVRQELKKLLSERLSQTKEPIHIVFCLSQYSKVMAYYAQSIEDVKEAVATMKPFTTHSAKKVRGCAWSAMSNLLGSCSWPAVSVSPMDYKRRSLDEFEISVIEPRVDARCLLPDVFEEPIDFLLKSTDPKAIVDVLKEAGPALTSVIESIWEVESGDLSRVNVVLWMSGFFGQDLVTDTLPAVKAKFIDAVCRLLKDFAENPTILENLIPMCCSVFFKGVVVDFAAYDRPFDYYMWSGSRFDGKYTASELLQRFMYSVLRRWNFSGIPITPQVQFIIEKLFEYATSRYKGPATKACQLLTVFLWVYRPFYMDTCAKLIPRLDDIPADDLLRFFCKSDLLCYVIAMESRLLRPVLEHFTKDFQAHDPETEENFRTFLNYCACQVFPPGSPQDHDPEWEDLMSRVVAKANENPKGVSIHLLAGTAIICALRYVKMPSKDVIAYLLSQTKSSDVAVNRGTKTALCSILYRMMDRQNVFGKITPFTVKDMLPLFRTDLKPAISKFRSMDDICEYISQMKPSPALPAERFCDPHTYGWFMFPKETPIVTCKPAFEELFLQEISGILESTLDNDTANCNTQFWMYVTAVFGQKTFDAIQPALHVFLEEELTDNSLNAISEYIEGAVLAFPLLSEESAEYCIRQVILPALVRITPNPHKLETIQQAIVRALLDVDPLRLRSIFDFLFQNTSGDHELSRTHRQLLYLLSRSISCRCVSLYPSIDALSDRYLKPFFDNITQYSFTHADDLLVFYVNLIEATCIPEYSPLYSPEVLERREYLLAFLDRFLVDGKEYTSDKAFHQVLANFFGGLTALASEAQQAILPILIKHTGVIFAALNSSDMAHEDLVQEGLGQLLKTTVFVEKIDIALSLIKAFVQSLDILSVPMQLKVLAQLDEMIVTTINAFTPEILQEIYDLFFALAKNIKSDDVLLEVVQIMGIISIHAGHREIHGAIQAAAILSVALLFDEVNPLVIEAFDIIAKKIENYPRSATTFYQQIVVQFWRTNSEHMMPKVEESVDPYRMLIAPDYCA